MRGPTLCDPVVFILPVPAISPIDDFIPFMIRFLPFHDDLSSAVLTASEPTVTSSLRPSLAL